MRVPWNQIVKEECEVKKGHEGGRGRSIRIENLWQSA